MKTKITIKCDIIIMEYASKDELFEEDFNSISMTVYGMEDIRGLYVNDDTDNNLIKQKGKYMKTKEYFHDLFKDMLPVEAHTRIQHYDIEYNIEHKDEFDIKKLQFVKSDYECDQFPYFIIADYILYDGQKVQAEEDLLDNFIDGKYYNTYTIKDLY